MEILPLKPTSPAILSITQFQPVINTIFDSYSDIDRFHFLFFPDFLSIK